MQSANCLVTGDTTVGKSSLLMCYTQNDCRDYNPCLNDCDVRITVDGRGVHLNIWDIITLEEYSALKMLQYPQANVLIICFSVASSTSYENVKLRWYPEACQHCPNVPILLLGTKKDLRDTPDDIAKAKNPNEAPITAEQGAMLAREIGAVKYMECSARSQENIKEVFEEAARAVLKPIPKKHKSACCMM